MLRRAALVVCLAAGIDSPSPATAAESAEQAVEVRVSSTDGAPLAGVTLTVSAAGAPSVAAQATTGDDGLAVLTLPAAPASYRLAATHPRHLPAASDFELKRPRRNAKPAAISITLSPKGAAEYFNEAVAALERHDSAAAEASLRAAVTTDPGFARGWTILAKLALDSGRGEQALEHAARALAADPAELMALHLRYEALSALGRVEEAESTLSELVTRDPAPELARLLFNSGAEAANHGDLERARRRLGEAAARDPGLWQAHSALAEVAIREQDYGAALAALDRALAIAPREERLRRRKVELLRAAGRGAEAEALEAELAAPPGG